MLYEQVFSRVATKLHSGIGLMMAGGWSSGREHSFPDINSKSLHPIQTKLWDIVIYQASENPIDFWENPFKVKVTVPINT